MLGGDPKKVDLYDLSKKGKKGSCATHLKGFDIACGVFIDAGVVLDHLCALSKLQRGQGLAKRPARTRKVDVSRC
jgi:hypothetical protein